VARLWPLAGRMRLVEQALLTALLEPAWSSPPSEN